MLLMGLAAGGLVIPPPTPVAASTLVTTTYTYTGSTQTFQVPAGVSTMTVTLKGGQGGLGGGDSQGSPIPGGYQGVVSGVINVTPGSTITIAVGGGGGTGVSSRGSAPGGTAGLNPLDGYDGAVGGIAGPRGSSGGGGGSGAASVLRIGSTDIVAAGAGGNGGNGQYLPIVGRRAEESHLARPDETSTTGRPGLNTELACSPGFNCDGGASGAGGGGAQGGDRGQVQYGGATATEYFGFGGYPGANSTGGYDGLIASYDYYAGNNANGSITISYDDGAPGAPLNLAGAAHTGSVGLTWTAPSASGSSPITDYRVEYATSSSGPFSIFDDGVSTALSAEVTGLTNGQNYFFRVSAINSEGVGSSATTSIAIVPSDVPAAPTVSSLTAFGAGIHVDFTPGASDAAITGYEYRLDGGAWIAGTVSSNRLSITGLTNGRTYQVELRELNSIGASAASSPAQSATPRDVAQAPSSVVAVAADGSVQLSWIAPTVDNGAAVTDYIVQTATSAGGPFTTFDDGVSNTTSATVTGLTNGVTYYARVIATNAVGNSPASTTAAATPYTTPNAPSVALTPGDGELSAVITPGFNGGSAVTAYEYRIGASGTWKTTGSLSTSFVIAGLTNGASTEVFVRSLNAAGYSPASSGVTGVPRTAPSAPAISTVALDTGAVSVTFTVGSDGGSPLTNVEYSINGGSTWITRNPASTVSPLIIGGLTGGETYPIRLRVVNAAGASAPSESSLVTAKGTPDAPTITVTPSDRSLAIVFSAPANGGSPILNYEYSINGGSSWTTRNPASTSSPIVVAGLTNGQSYDVRLRAVNAVGNGPASSIVSGTPRTTPGAPTIDEETIVGVDGALDVVFSAPSSDGGSEITTYEYSTDGGLTWLERQTGTTDSPLRITVESSDGVTELVGGEVYPVEIRAVNAAGHGTASAVAEGITTTAPGAPTNIVVDARDSSASIRFTPPANGGSAIIRFEYRLNGGSWIDTGSLSDEFVINDLTNSTSYSLELRAVNGVGDGPASAAAGIEVYTTPGAPELGEITLGDGSLSVAFTAGDDGGTEITGYEYSTDGGLTWRARATGTTASPLVITTESGVGAEALTNGEVYPIQLRAVNAAGAGAASETRLVAPRGAPQALSNVVVSNADEALMVSFTAGSDGGSAITAIEYQINGGEWIDAGSLNSPITVTGLTNGTTYDIAVRARNAVAPGAASTTESGTPRTVPSEPTSVVAGSGAGEVSVSWGAPTFDGGADVTSYTVTVYDQAAGGTPIGTCTTSTTTCTVTGLTNGVTVYADVVATNEAGSGLPSSPRSAQTPLAAPQVAIDSITPSGTELSVAVDVIDDGGAAITAYQYQLDGGEWQTAATASNPFVISGLTTGVSYSVRIRAITPGGTGAATSAVVAIPHTAPGAPTSLSALSAPSSAVLTWSAPANNGGQPVTNYVIEYATNVSGPFTTFGHAASSATTATVTGLTNATTYVFRVAAVNTAGAGSWSSLASATPLGAPTAPTITTITPGSRFLQVAFTAPTGNGGSAITGYEYQLDGGAWRSATGTTSPLMITGLTNGQTYDVKLRAVNVVGGGDASNTVAAKPYGLPAAVIGFRATPGVNNVTLDWDIVNDNGSPITAYNVIRWSAATEGSISASFQTTSTTHTFTGLGNGTYYFTVEATNAAGTGPRSSPRTTAIVGSTLPSAPTSVVTDVDGDQATMSWTAPAAGTSAITSYIVQYSTNGTTWTTMSSGSSATSATFTLPSTSTAYSLRVAAISAAGLGAFSTVRPPLAGSTSVSEIGTQTATVDATVNANDGEATVSFEVATDVDDFGTEDALIVAATPESVNGSDTTAVTAELGELTPGTIHYVRVRIQVGDLVVHGATQTFGTDATIVSSGLEPVYTGLPVVITSETQPAGLELTRTYLGIDGTVYPSSTTAPTGVGTYQVTTTPANEAIGGVEVVTVTIAPKPVTVDVSVTERAYDGTTDAELTFVIDGAVDGDDVTVDESRISGAFDDANVGVDKTVTITAESDVLAGDDAANYSAEVDAEALGTIVQAEQTLEFTSTAPTAAEVDDTYTPTAVSTAGLTPTLSIADSAAEVCSLSSGVVTLIGVGTCVIVAAQDGNANVAAATNVEQSFEVVDTAPEPQVITITGLEDTALDAGPIELPANTPEDMPLTYTAGPSSVCTVSGTTLTLHGAGLCTVTADQAGDDDHLPATATASFQVTKIVQTVTIPGLGDISIDASPLTLPATTSTGLPLTYTAGPSSVCTVSGLVLTLVGEGTCTVTAHQAGNATTAPATASTSFIVKPPMLKLTLQLGAGESVSNAPVVVEGSNLKPNTQVRIELHSTPILLGTVMTNGSGSFRTTVHLPADVPAGSHEIVAIGIKPDGTTLTTTESLFVDWSGSFSEVQTSGGYTPIVATRVLDTRESGKRLVDRTERRLVIPSKLTPDDVTAVVLNLTVTESGRDGFITVYPCGSTRPLAAAINFTAGETKANLVDAIFQPGDALCLWSNVDPHVVVDVQGFHSESGEGRLVPRTAVRLVDTRPADALDAGDVLRIPVVGSGKARNGATTVALNVAVDEPQRSGFLTVYPCGIDRPWASNLNFRAGQTVSNEVMVEPGDDGAVCVYTTSPTQLIVDLNASYDPAGDEVFTAMVAGRFADTRLTTKLEAGQAFEWTIVGDEAAAEGTTAVSLNIAVTEPDGAGFLTVYPCGTKPWTSNLNFAAGQTISNHVTATVSDEGTICVFSNQTTHVVIDVEGAYRAQ